MTKAQPRSEEPWERGASARYRFDYGKARPNRFAERIPHGTVAVVLDPEVASVFESSTSVNTLLRSVIKAMPDRARKRRKVG
jgi:hypothetical protein